MKRRQFVVVPIKFVPEQQYELAPLMSLPLNVNVLSVTTLNMFSELFTTS